MLPVVSCPGESSQMLPHSADPDTRAEEEAGMAMTRQRRDAGCTGHGAQGCPHQALFHRQESPHWAVRVPWGRNPSACCLPHPGNSACSISSRPVLVESRSTAEPAPPTHHTVHNTDVPVVLPQPGVHVPAGGVQAVQVWGPPGCPAALGDLWEGPARLSSCAGAVYWPAPHSCPPCAALCFSEVC